MLPVPDRIKTENRLALLRGIALLPMILYPWVFMAGITTLGSKVTQNMSEVFDTIAILVAFLYPITLFVCLRHNRKRSVRIAAMPLWHLGLTLLLVAISILSESP